MNQFQLTGSLVRNSKSTRSASGVLHTDLVVVNNPYSEKDKEKFTFDVRVSAGKGNTGLATTAAQLRKGNLVSLSGNIRSQNVNGVWRTSLIATEVEFLGMSIDALKIHEQLADKCGEAVRYYGRWQKKSVLEQGAADFDQKFNPDDTSEKTHYRTDYYVHGYMGMHLIQNLSALRYCFKKRIPQPLLFVDFGCGPMTSGLALAQVLSKQITDYDYKTHTSYFGIDASRNMVAKANDINRKYDLFAPDRFEVMQGTEFDSQKIPQSFPEPQIVVL